MAAEPSIYFISSNQVMDFNSFLMNFNNFYQQEAFSGHQDHFKNAIAKRSDPARHGDLPNWLSILNALPEVSAQNIKLDRDLVLIGERDEINDEQAQAIHAGLLALAPWRKGPFSVFGSEIDTEWRSDWKWQRLIPHIANLEDRTILDVGCGSGYHCWRMLGGGAKYVLGIDPSMRFQIQHRALQKFAGSPKFDLLPLGIEDMPSDLPIFDTVFSMGVLYHRKDPLGHVEELFGLLQAGGEVVLETLIIDSDNVPSGVFTPSGRYAQMRNVWSITTIEKTLELLEQAGFRNARCVDINITSTDEQRQTQWMSFHSLEQFLDPLDHSLTIEGHPAPKRGIFLADKPAV